jgi:hypothetical protein
MGPCFREDDHLISALLDLANLRFAPMLPQVPDDGIREMQSLQQKFQVFSLEHSLAESFAVLGLGGFWNPVLKNKLYKYLEYLRTVGFEINGSETGENGERGIITALRENLASKSPHPVYFTTHDLQKDSRVVAHNRTPLVYMKHVYLTISLPMVPWESR